MTADQRAALLASVNGELESAEHHELRSPAILAAADARDVLLGDGTVVLLAPADVALLVEALDSHVYWQLSDTVYRRDGYVNEPGAAEPEQAEKILEANALHDQLESLARPEVAT